VADTEVVEEHKVLDATPAAVALATILTLEQLEELERKMLELEQVRGSHETTLRSEGTI
jgi:hypothetical protein